MAAEKKEQFYLEEVRKAQPAWQKDAKGIRGDPVIVSNTRAKLNWESISVFRRPNLEISGD